MNLQPSLPFSGRSPRARHASLSGAVKAEARRSMNIERLRALWVDPWTLNEIAKITCLPLSSVCSLKASLESELVAVDFVDVIWPDGKTTKRCRWQLVSAQCGGDSRKDDAR